MAVSRVPLSLCRCRQQKKSKYILSFILSHKIIEQVGDLRHERYSAQSVVDEEGSAFVSVSLCLAHIRFRAVVFKPSYRETGYVAVVRSSKAATRILRMSTCLVRIHEITDLTFGQRPWDTYTGTPVEFLVLGSFKIGKGCHTLL